MSKITRHGLSKSLKSFDTLALGFGAIIGWSWIALISETMVRSGSLGAVVATVLAGGVIVAIGLIYGELASAMPEVGGEHAYSLRALGRTGAFVCTWAIALTYVAVVGFEAVALPNVMSNLFPGLGQGELWSINGAVVYLDQALIGAGASALITWLNIRGIRIAAFVQLVIVGVIILSGIMLFAGAGVSGEAINMSPAWLGTGGLLAAMALVPFMMVGFDVIPQTAEEIDLDPRKIGLLIVLSLIMAVGWYVLIELAVALLVPAGERPSGTLATIVASNAAWGRTGAILMLIGGFAGILTSWNAFLIGGSRALFAMAAHGMLPAVFARVHPKYHTPIGASLFIGVIGVIAPFLGRQSLIWFVNAGGFSLMIAFFLVAWSFIKLRRDEPDMPRPYRAPAGPFLGWFGIGASVAMAALYMPGMPAALVWPQEWLMILVWFIAGWMMYRASSNSREVDRSGAAMTSKKPEAASPVTVQEK